MAARLPDIQKGHTGCKKRYALFLFIAVQYCSGVLFPCEVCSLLLWNLFPLAMEPVPSCYGICSLLLWSQFPLVMVFPLLL